MNSFENDYSSATRSFINACSASCQKFRRSFEAAKQSMLREFRQVLGPQQHMLELALSEAEALAHETGFPLLVYPTLAREKVEAVAAWKYRQQALMRRTKDSLLKPLAGLAFKTRAFGNLSTGISSGLTQNA